MIYEIFDCLATTNSFSRIDISRMEDSTTHTHTHAADLSDGLGNELHSVWAGKSRRNTALHALRHPAAHATTEVSFGDSHARDVSGVIYSGRARMSVRS